MVQTFVVCSFFVALTHRYNFVCKAGYQHEGCFGAKEANGTVILSSADNGITLTLTGNDTSLFGVINSTFQCSEITIFNPKDPGLPWVLSRKAKVTHSFLSLHLSSKILFILFILCVTFFALIFVQSDSRAPPHFGATLVLYPFNNHFICFAHFGLFVCSHLHLFRSRPHRSTSSSHRRHTSGPQVTRSFPLQ